MSQGSDRETAGNQIQPGGEVPAPQQQEQELPVDSQDYQDLGPFDEQEQHGGRDGQPGRQGPRAKRQPR